MDKQEDPFYVLEQKEKEMRDLLFSVLTENARLIEDNKRLRKEAEKTMDLLVDGKKVASVKEIEAFKVNMPENIVCDFCKKLMPALDMLHVWEGEGTKSKRICKNCISFVDDIKEKQ